MILEILSAGHGQRTKMDSDSDSDSDSNSNSNRQRSPEMRRRILILGHTVNSDEMVALQVKGKTKPWITYGLSFGSEKVSMNEIHHPAVAWCKGLAMVHTGSSFAYRETKLHRMKQVTELMQFACDNSVVWHDLDFHALKVCTQIGSIEVQHH